MFFSFDGIDGVGKSTQVTLFCRWLRERGHDVYSCRDPGTTPLGESIRSLLLAHDLAKIDRRAEMLLYMAARTQLVEECIRPALENGKTVVSDRFLLANVAYQAHGGGLDVDAVWSVGRVATGGLMPELTFLLDMDVSVASNRIDGKKDRMESHGMEFWQRVRTGFLEEAARHPDSIVVIDAGRQASDVQAEIRSASQRVLSIQPRGTR